MAVGTPSLPNKPTVPEVINTAAEKFGWGRHSTPPAVLSAHGGSSPLRRGRGFAAGFKNIGFSFGYKENCWARVELHGKAEIETVAVWSASAEVGQEQPHTILAQIAAEATRRARSKSPPGDDGHPRYRQRPVRASALAADRHVWQLP